MTYKVMQNGTQINIIEASAEFAAQYAKETGCTCELVIPVSEKTPEPTDEVALLKAKVAALTQSNANLEECLVEMAGIVYA